MTVSKRRPLKLKGAVLIMVITILFVFILMLLATLAVVSSTTRRTYTKYEENQAYYTARSVLEVYMAEYLENEEAYGNSSDVSKVISAMEAQGIELEVTDELGNVTSGADVFINADYTGGSFNKKSNETWKYKDFAGGYISNGFLHQQEIFGYLKPKYDFIDESNMSSVKDIRDDKHWKLASHSGEPYYIEFDASVPDVSSSEKGKFDYDGKVKLRIELLRVLYQLKDGSVHDTVNRGSGDFAVGDIDWSNSYYRIKVSSTANLGDGAKTTVDGVDIPENNSEITVSVILEPAVKISPSGFSNAMTSFDATNADNKMFTVGGASASNPGGTTNATNNSTICGNYLYESNFYVNAGAEWYQDKNTHFVCQGGIIHSQNDLEIRGDGDINETDTKELSKRPYVYSQGMYLWGECGTGNDEACDIVISARDKDGNFVGTLGDEKSWAVPAYISSQGAEARMAFIADQNGCEVYGDMYVDGDMYIKSSTIVHGNIYCTGTIYVDGEYNFCEGEIYTNAIANAADGVLVANPAAYASSVETESAEVAGLELAWDEDKYDQNSGEMVLELPKRGEIHCSTTASVTSNYVYQNGDTDIPKGKSPGDIISAEEMFEDNTSTEKASLKVSDTAPSLKKDTFINETITLDDKSYTGKVLDPVTMGQYNSNTDMNEMVLNATNFANFSDTVYINATESNVHIELRGEMDSARPKFVVVGDKSVVFTVDDNTKTSFAELTVLTAQLDDMVTNNDVMYVGNELKPGTSNNPSAPNITFYIGADSTFEMRNCGQSIISGYIYGPEAHFYANTNQGKNLKYSYNGSDERSTSNISFLGSVVFETIGSQNEIGVIYIDPSTGDSKTNAGGNMDWDRTRYLNVK